MTNEETQLEKLNLITWISQLKDVSLLEKLRAFKISLENETDWYDLLSEEQKQAIENAKKSLKDGKGISNEDAQKRIRSFIESKRT